MTKPQFAMALHGGAGARPGKNYSVELKHMQGLIEAGRDCLRAGRSALDVSTQIVAALENSGLYIAGRGGSPNTGGVFELDASVMDGETGKSGAVTGLQGYGNPIEVARAVMERTPHALLAGEGAGQFARAQGLRAIENPHDWFVPACLDEFNQLPDSIQHGTVGCVVLDEQGRLASATSTAGVFGKMPGRCGDTALIGAGGWADRTVAVSCTGQGEFFIRAAAAVQVAHRMRWASQSLEAAARATLAHVAALGGRGGLIAVDAAGDVCMPYISSGMKRAALLRDGSITAEVFGMEGYTT